MYNSNSNPQRGYNSFDIPGTQQHDVSGVEVALENNKIVIHLPVSLLVPITINGVIVLPSREKNENTTREALGFSDPNITLSKEPYKKLGKIWAPHYHSFIVGNRVYTMGSSTQKDQVRYSDIMQDITNVHYNGDINALRDGLNKFFETNRLF